MVLTIKKLGGSVALVIPKAMAVDMRFEAGTSVEVTTGPEGMTVRRPIQRPRRSMKELVKKISRANYRKQSAALGEPGVVGKEFW